MEARVLWDILDAAGIAFRSPRHALLAAGLYDDGWRQHGQVAALVPGLATPLLFATAGRQDPSLPPDRFYAYERTSRFWWVNHRNLVRKVTAVLGPGQVTGASNTRGVAWRFGVAHVSVTTFPPRLQRSGGVNDRHRLVRRSKVEAALEVVPGWCAPLSDAERAILTDYDAVTPARRASWVTALTRARDGQDGPDSGFGFAGGGHWGVVWGPDRLDLIDLSRVIGVTAHVLTPAKGGGGQYVSLAYRRASDDVEAELSIADSGSLFNEDEVSAQAELAQGLAARLDVPLREVRFADC